MVGCIHDNQCVFVPMTSAVGVDPPVGWSSGNSWNPFLYILEFIEVEIVESKHVVTQKLQHNLASKHTHVWL